MFNRDQVFNIIENYLEENSDIYTLSESDKAKTYTTYVRLMSEERNINKNPEEQERLITSMIIGRNTPNKKGDVESWERIFTEHSDLKHLSYFDNFMREGELEKILKALKKNKLSTNVLRGIRLENSKTNIDGVKIIQEVAENDEKYKYVSYFEIQYNGQTIYKYEGTNYIKSYKNESSFENRLEELSENIDYYSDEQITRIRKKINTQKGKIIEDYYSTSKGNAAKRTMGYYTDKNGKRRFGFISGGLI